MSRKVVILFGDGVHYSLHWGIAHKTYSQLKTLGYEVDVLVIDDANSGLLTDLTDYEFGICVQGSGIGTSYYTNFLGGESGVPVFHINNIGSGAFSYYGHGLEASDGTIVYRKCTLVGSSVTLPLYCETRKVSATGAGNGPFNTADYEVLVTADDDTTAFENIVVARWNGGTHPVYMDSCGTTFTMLPIMLQHAITAGDLSAPPRKGLIMQDLDDFPAALTTHADHVAAYDIMEQYGIPMSWGIHGDDLADHADSVWTWVESKSKVNNGYIYPIEHQGGTFWNDTKSNIDTFYRSHITSMQAKGITTGDDSAGLDSFGYHYFNTNRFNDNGAQLASPHNAEFCSVAGATKQEGYGFRVCRITLGLKTGEATDANGQLWCNDETSNGFDIHRGMMLLKGVNTIASTDLTLDIDDGPSASAASGVAHYALHCLDSWLFGGLAYNDIMYLHGSNFYDGHDSGTAPGQLALQIGGAVVNYCSDVLKFAHPTELADRFGKGKGARQPDG